MRREAPPNSDVHTKQQKKAAFAPGKEKLLSVISTSRNTAELLRYMSGEPALSPADFLEHTEHLLHSTSSWNPTCSMMQWGHPTSADPCSYHHMFGHILVASPRGVSALIWCSVSFGRKGRIRKRTLSQSLTLLPYLFNTDMHSGLQLPQRTGLFCAMALGLY